GVLRRGEVAETAAEGLEFRCAVLLRVGGDPRERPHILRGVGGDVRLAIPQPATEDVAPAVVPPARFGGHEPGFIYAPVPARGDLLGVGIHLLDSLWRAVR